MGNLVIALLDTGLGGGIGRRKGLKIPWGLVPVRVRFPPQASPVSTRVLSRSYLLASGTMLCKYFPTPICKFLPIMAILFTPFSILV